MTKTLFRSRRREAPSYPTRDDDRRRLLAAGLGALLAAGPLAGCEARSALAAPASKSAPADSLRRGGVPRQPRDAGQPAPHELAETSDAGTPTPYPEPLGGAPPPPRDPVQSPPPSPQPPTDGGAGPDALDGEPMQPE